MDKKLSPIWFIEKNIDFEYQKYILLDYLQYVDLMFANGLLYPTLSEIEYHQKNLESFIKTRELIVSGTRELKGFDFEKMTLLYDTPQDTPDFIAINNIINYAEPKFQEYCLKGSHLYQEIEKNISMRYVGIVPPDRNYGFLIMNIDNYAHIYSYEMCRITIENDFYVKLDEIDIQRMNFTNTYEHIKLDLLNKFTQYTNPAVIAADIFKTYPLKEGIIPVIRRKISAYLNKNA
jgi:hypothetical protein